MENTENNNKDGVIDLSSILNNSTPDISFQGDRPPISIQPTNDDLPGITKWVIKHSGGQIKDERQADYVILFFVVLTILFSIFLFFYTTKEKKVEIEINPLTGEELIPGQFPGGF